MSHYQDEQVRLLRAAVETLADEGISQTEIAEAVSRASRKPMSREVVCRAISGRANPTLATVGRIWEGIDWLADKYDISVE
jgi:DNA-binding phage protein